MRKVDIIIVNWNTGDCLARCLRSLQILPEQERSLIGEVVVVDNNSADNSLVKAQVAVGESINKPKVRFLRRDQNEGFARANNLALETLRGKGGPPGHILLLNPDTEVRPGALSAMVQALEQNPRAGVAGPRLLNPDGTGQPSVRSLPDFKVFLWLTLKLNRLAPHAALWRKYLRDDFDYSRESAAEQIMGAAFMIKENLPAEIGFLDENFRVWFEEVDYCYRVRQAGYKVIYTPRGEVVHQGAVSFKQLVGFKRSWPWLKSMLRYADKHMRRRQRFILRLLLPVSLLLVLPAAVFHLSDK